MGRRHHIALEAKRPPAPEPVVVMSLEEADLFTQEVTADAADIETDLTEAERMLERTDALEDIAVVASNIEEATPTELALIDQASQMAVAGEDVDPQALIPVTESYLGGRIATEDIKEKAKHLWEQIQAMIQRIWEQIQHYFRVYAVVPTYEHMLKESLDAFKKVKDAELQTDSFKVSLRAFSADGKVVGDYTELRREVEYVEMLANFVYGDYAESVIARGKAATASLAGFGGKGAGDVVDDLVSTLSGIQGPAIPQSKKDQPEGGFEVACSHEVLGGGYLVRRTFKAKPDADPLANLDHLRKTGVRFEQETQASRAAQGKSTGDTKNFAALNASEVEELRKIAQNLLNGLKKFEKGATLTNLRKTGNELRDASKRAADELSKSDDANVSASDFRAALNINEAYARWVQQPVIPFNGVVLNAVKAITFAINKSAACYAQPEAREPKEQK